MRPLLWVLLGVLVTQSVAAHESRPGYLELRETEPGVYTVLWKQPTMGDRTLNLDPVFPDACSAPEAVAADALDAALLVRWTIRCEGGLSGKSVYVAGLERTLTDVLVRVTHASGETETHLLRPAAPSVVLGGSGGGKRAAAFLRLGVEHILLGVDHLLFVLGLLFIVRERWMLWKTITSFTIAHSITLALATLGFASVPVIPLNAAIALSILFLGPEIVRARQGGTSLTIRHPWIVAFAFGLLHGFGFASGLTTMGLPRNEIPLALLLFNVGVEAGQVAFVFLVLGLGRSFRALEVRWPRVVEILPAYVVGSLGAYWTIQRTIALVAGAR